MKFPPSFPSKLCPWLTDSSKKNKSARLTHYPKESTQPDTTDLNYSPLLRLLRYPRDLLLGIQE